MEDTIRILLILIPALPLAAAALTAVLGPRLLRGNSHWIVVVALLGSLVCSLLLIREVTYEQEDASEQSVGYRQVCRIWTWANVQDSYSMHPRPAGESSDSIVEGGLRNFRVDVVLRADALTAVMLVMVTFVAFLVAVYSVGYMHGDRGYWRFFSYIGLFVFSMTMLVSVSNFVLLFVFWEAVGLCSYLLIGFWYEKPEAAAAGKKAFLVNRIGDFGFTLALFLIWTTYGTLNYHDTLKNGETEQAVVDAVVEQLQQDPAGVSPDRDVVRGVLGKWRLRANDYVGRGTAFAICLLLLLGACGKSAQFPLHVWLPDAMEGPTPVSALIHAATMVTAGVYMVVRCTPLFMASPDAQLIVSIVGTVTALLAGMIALTQFDLKRVLAYSTVSQLGYMFLALGTGTLAGISAGMFHLFTHAFFKALLFLGAGSVMHAMGNVIDMRRFGGLRKLMPVTYVTFAVGCLALAGIAPLSGFWSKDGLVASVHDKAHALMHHDHGGHEGESPGDGHVPAQPGHAGPDSSGTSTLAAGAVVSPTSLAAAAVTGMLRPVNWKINYVSEGGESVSGHSAPDGVLPITDEQRGRIYLYLYYAAMVTALLTSFYTFRAFFMTFHGEQRVPHEAGHHAHESPLSMTGPLIVLAICAALVGLAFDQTWVNGTHLFAQLLAPTPSLAASVVQATPQAGTFHLDVAVLSSLIAFGGLGLAFYLYMGRRDEVEWVRQAADLVWLQQLSDVESISRLRRTRAIVAFERGCQALRISWLATLLGYVVLMLALIVSAPLLLGYFVTPYRLSLRKFYFDEIYDVLLVRPLKWLAAVSYAIDRWVVDGLVNACGRIPPLFGSLMRSLQMGLVPFYATAMVWGVLVLLAPPVLMALAAYVFGWIGEG